MTALRPRIGALGLVLAALGLGMVVYPDAAGTLGLPRLAVVLLGAVALLEAARSVAARRRTGIDGAATPTPEFRRVTRTPGDKFDERIAVLGRVGGTRRKGGVPRRVRQRLHRAAVEAAAHRWRLTPAAARDRIEAGEWTDDPAAAWFLGGSHLERPPWTLRARAVLAREPSADFYVTRAVRAIVALREEP